LRGNNRWLAHLCGSAKAEVLIQHASGFPSRLAALMVGTNQLLLRGEKSYHSMGVGPSDDNSHNEDNEAQNVWGYLERTLAGVSIETKGVKFRAGLLSHLKIWWPGTELNFPR